MAIAHARALIHEEYLIEFAETQNQDVEVVLAGERDDPIIGQYAMTADQASAHPDAKANKGGNVPKISSGELFSIFK
jgi:hypothetical protein